MVEYLISLSLLICVVLLIRGIFRKTISPRAVYALWLVVVIRMLLPITLFEVDVTLPAFLQNRQTEQMEQLPNDLEMTTDGSMQSPLISPVQTTPNTPTQNTTPVTPMYPSVTTPMTPIMPTNPVETTPAAPITPETKAEPSVIPKEPTTELTEEPVTVDWKRIADTIWFIGAVVAAVWVMFTSITYSRRLVKDRRLHRTVRGTKVYVSGRAGVPCIAGLIPSIYITPEAANSKSEMLIIIHEHVHLCHGDHIWAIIRALAMIVFWWNPLVWAAATVSKQDAELACDNAISAKLNDDGRLKYANILLDTIPQKHRYAVGFGSAPMKERILMLTTKQKNRWICLVLAVVLTVSAVGCSFVGTRKVTTDNIQQSGQNEQQVKTYNSMDEYVADRMSQETTVTYYSNRKYNASPDGGAAAWTATANVIDTKLILLEKKGEVIGLAADGTLECWEYKYLIKLDVPTEDVMMVDEAVDGWWDMEGQGNHTTVVLRSPNGTYTVLRDKMVGDGIDFTGYRNSYEEAIYDWYVTEYGLNLPLYVQDWTKEIIMPDGEYIGNQPVYRFDGDGWSVYIPVAAWYQSTDAKENQWIWRSSYNTGSTLIVDVLSNALDDEYVIAEKQGYTPIDDTSRVWELYKDGTHSYYYYYENPNGGFWRLTIRWKDEVLSGDNPNVAIEPQLLKLMAEKFVVYEKEINVSLDAEHGPFIGYVADAETPWIDLYTEKNGTYVGRIPYEIFHDWVATDRSSESWTSGWMNEYIHFYYAEFGDFRWAAAHLTNTVLGSGRKNVATSSDGGEMWDVGSTGDDYSGNHVVGMGFISDKIAFMSFDPYNEYEETDGPVISRTIDGGKTWERLDISVPESLKEKKLIPGIPFYDGEVLRYPVWLSPSHGAKEGDPMYLISYDKGLTWEWELQTESIIALSEYKNAPLGNGLVYEGYTVEFNIPYPTSPDKTFDFHIHLPQISDGSAEAEKWNAEILENYNQIFGEYLRKSANGTNFSFYADVTYNTVTTGNIVTIYIINANGILNSGAAELSYDIYHYDTVRKKFLTTNEFLAYYAEGQFADYTVADIVKFMNDNVFETDEVGNTYHLIEENIQGVIPSVFGDGKFDVVYQGFVMEGSHATRVLFSPYPTHSQMSVKNNVWADYTYRLTYHEYTNCRDKEIYGQPAGYRLLISERSAGNYNAGYYVDCLFLEDIAEPPKRYTGDHYVPMETYNDGRMYMVIDHETDKGHLNIMIPFDKPNTAHDYYRGVLQKYFSYDRILCGNYQVNEDIAGLVAEVLDAYRNEKYPNELFPASKTKYTPYPLKTVRDNPNADEIGEILKNASVGASGIINFSIDLGEDWRMGLPIAIGGFGESWQAYFTGVYISKDGVEINIDADNAEQESQMDLQELYQSVLKDKTMVYSLSAEHGMYLSELLQSHGDTYPIAEYSIIDLNRDGIPELVLSKSSGNYLILRVEEKKVYAHSLPYRSLMYLKEDGTLSWSSGASDWGIGRIDFDGYTYEYDKIAYCRFDYDNQTEIYFIESRNATTEEFDAYVAVQSLKPDAVWYEYETGN